MQAAHAAAQCSAGSPGSSNPGAHPARKPSCKEVTVTSQQSAHNGATMEALGERALPGRSRACPAAVQRCSRVASRGGGLRLSTESMRYYQTECYMPHHLAAPPLT